MTRGPDFTAKWPFTPHYLKIDGIKIHYVDEGWGPPILLLHGQPTWSYLYRKMIPPLVAAGYRCIAPDLMGFGRSDKPEAESAYTLVRHGELITGLIESLRLENLTLVLHDWGGPIGLRYAIGNRDNVRALVILNTLVRALTSIPWFGHIFLFLFANGRLSSFLTRRLDLFRRFIFRGGFYGRVDPEVMEQYMKPHHTARSRAGVAAFPKMLPASPDHPNTPHLDEIEQALGSWEVPVLVMFSDKDAFFTIDDGRRIADMIPNGRFAPVHNAGHYLQEEAGEEIAARIVTFLRDEATLIDPGSFDDRAREIKAGEVAEAE